MGHALAAFHAGVEVGYQSDAGVAECELAGERGLGLAGHVDDGAAGGTIINMTGQPEAALARELALCYTSIALVTDLDAGVEGSQGVTHDEVLRAFAKNVTVLRRVLFDAVAALPVERTCPCSRAFAVPVDLDAG